MPIPVRTQRFGPFEEVDVGIYEANVPEAERWVIEDMVATAPGSDVLYGPALGMAVIEALGGVVLWNLIDTCPFPGMSLHWTGKQVIDFPSSIVVIDNGEGWRWAICGYSLTLP